MIVLLRPVGRGNWKPLTIIVHGPGGLFPLVRDDDRTHVKPEDRWILAGREWRVVEVTP